jgi:hypothetical protein
MSCIPMYPNATLIFEGMNHDDIDQEFRWNITRLSNSPYLSLPEQKKLQERLYNDTKSSYFHILVIWRLIEKISKDEEYQYKRDFEASFEKMKSKDFTHNVQVGEVFSEKSLLEFAERIIKHGHPIFCNSYKSLTLQLFNVFHWRKSQEDLEKEKDVFLPK